MIGVIELPTGSVQMMEPVAHRRVSAKERLAIAIVLAYQVAIAATLTNTAFEDEALYLFEGRLVLGDPSRLAEDSSYFSGFPLFYPVIGGLLDGLGGLELARTLSTVAMLGATLAIFGTTRVLYGRRPALAAIAVFATVSSVAFVSRLATYDAISLALLTWAMYFAVSSARSTAWRASLCVLAGSAAVVAKYAAAGFIPAIAILLLFAPDLTSRDRLKAVGSATATAAAVGVLVVGVVAAHPELAVGLSATTTARVAIAPADPQALLVRAATVDGPIVLAALAGVALLAWKRAPMAVHLRSLALVLGVAVVPAYHLVTRELTSYDKHLGYAAAFAAPLAGLAIDRLVVRRMGRVNSISLLVLLVLLGSGLARGMFNGGWPNTAPLNLALRETIGAADSRIFAQTSQVPRYYLSDLNQAGRLQWTGQYYFQYAPEGGQELTGEDAYRAAIQDCYFDVIVLQPDSGDELISRIAPAVQAAACYELVATVEAPNQPATGTSKIWHVRRTSAESARPR